MDSLNLPSARIPRKKEFPQNLLDFKEGPGNLQYEGIKYRNPAPEAPEAPVPTPPPESPTPAPDPDPIATLPKPRKNVRVRKTKVPDSQPCTICNTTFAAGTHLAHLATHIPAGTSFCPFCGLDFSCIPLDHLGVHSNDRPFECAIVDCGVAYKKKALLNKHMASAHGGGSAGSTGPSANAATDMAISNSPGRYPGDNKDNLSAGYYSTVTGNWLGGVYGHKVGGPRGYGLMASVGAL